jgi:hypothetical protein
MHKLLPLPKEDTTSSTLMIARLGSDHPYTDWLLPEPFIPLAQVAFQSGEDQPLISVCTLIEHWLNEQDPLFILVSLCSMEATQYCIITHAFDGDDHTIEAIEVYGTQKDPLRVISLSPFLTMLLEPGGLDRMGDALLGKQHWQKLKAWMDTPEEGEDE